MPVYQYQDTRTGELVELVRKVDERDKVPSHLKRITVPARVGYANHSGLREPGADVSVPKAFKDYEAAGNDVRKIERETGFSREHIRKVWDF